MPDKLAGAEFDGRLHLVHDLMSVWSRVHRSDQSPHLLTAHNSPHWAVGLPRSLPVPDPLRTDVTVPVLQITK